MLHETRPDIEPHVFDVSSLYRAYWDRFVSASAQSVDRIPAEWQGRFDLLTSFFSLEHVVEPRTMVAEFASLLRDGGWLHLLVPNIFANHGDLLVADHVSQFSEASLRRLLSEAGFTIREIDPNAHISSLVVSTQKEPSIEPLPKLEPVTRALEEIAAYWVGFGDAVRAFETQHPSDTCAIYGSGFYGTFIGTNLEHFERVDCFLDRNPFRQQQTQLDRPIRSPEALPETVRSIYVGLDPRTAREEIARVDGLQSRGLDFILP